MDEIELGSLLSRVTSALDCAKDTEKELFRMQMTLISDLKKYRDPRTYNIDETEAVSGNTVRVIEAADEDDSIESPANNADLVGHLDVTARLPDSDDEDVSIDGRLPCSLEVHKKREEKRQREENCQNNINPLKKYPLLNKIGISAQNRSTTQIKPHTSTTGDTSAPRESHAEVSDESSDESYRTPSSSHCDLLSSDSNPPVIPEEREEVAGVRKNDDQEVPDVVGEDKRDKGTPDTTANKNMDFNSNETSSSEPFTIIPSQSQKRPGPNPWSYSRGVSSPAWSSTTPVDTPDRGFETLPAHTNLLPKCPFCGLVFTEDHDFSYRNFHANTCFDSLV